MDSTTPRPTTPRPTTPPPTGDRGGTGGADGTATGESSAVRPTGRASGRDWWWQRTKDFDEEVDRLKAPDGNALLGWLLMTAGPASDLAQGRLADPWPAVAGLALFCVLYVTVVRAAFSPRLGGGPVPFRLLCALGGLTLALGLAYGRNFLLLFVLVALAAGAVSRTRRGIGLMLIPISAAAGVASAVHHQGFWSTVSLAYGTFLSGLVVSVIITLFHSVNQLKATRQELARAAVAQERLRFSRDLHDLLGHTLSVVVVKSEAAQRLAHRDLDAALAQVADIESVGRQALTEIREAVTGYREGSLSTELDRARSVLAASDVEVEVRESGPPLPPRTEALLGWVVREGVTNVVRHSGASRTVVELRTEGGVARLTITDDGCGCPGPAAPGVHRTGTGLRGLSERLAAAGGSLASGPAPGGGFQVRAELPVGPSQDGSP
ncbi:sensor histidine kinase [Actinacidiphila yeochonensis]|uniref:sensor histidine kinase n=1 Tax=Actinacidiphila yeochonensis TaxID=89050 RepID=UPI000AA9AB82|nr:sensor histidine kinase [Actinacidiphila yeochonensis]